MDVRQDAFDDQIRYEGWTSNAREFGGMRSGGFEGYIVRVVAG